MSVLHFPHPATKNLKKVHRLVVLPDYQGIGLASALLNTIGSYYKKLGYNITKEYIDGPVKIVLFEKDV